MREEFILKIKSLLWNQWDPIGLNKRSEQTDEYDSYAPLLCDALLKGADEETLFQLLWSIETVNMGLDGDESSTRNFANRLKLECPNTNI